MIHRIYIYHVEDSIRTHFPDGAYCYLDKERKVGVYINRTGKIIASFKAK